MHTPLQFSVLLAFLPASLPGQDPAISTRASDPRGVGVVVDSDNDKVFLFDTATDRVLGSVDTPGGNFPSDVVIDRSRTFAYVTKVNRVIWVIDLRDRSPKLASGVNPIPITATGQDLAFSADQRFLITTGPSSSPWLTSVVDVASRAEVFWADTGRNEAVEVCNDGSVLISSASHLGTRWYTLDSTGTLTPQGNPLIGGGFHIVCEPSGRTAVGLEQNELVSFEAGLQEIARGSPRFTFPSSTSLAFDAAGSTLFVRRWGMGSAITLEAIGYQQGQFDVTPKWIVSIPPMSASVYGNETIAVDDLQGKVYVSRPGGVDVFSMASGASLGTIVHPDLVYPFGIDVVDAVGR